MGEQRRRYQAANGVIRSTITDDDKLIIHTEQYLDSILESIKRDREIMTNRGDNKLLGRLPMFVVEDLIKREIYDDGPLFDKWWNSPEADPWRIWNGSV